MVESASIPSRRMADRAEEALEEGNYATVFLIYHQALGFPGLGENPSDEEAAAAERIKSARWRAARAVRREEPLFAPEVAGLAHDFRVIMRGARNEDGTIDVTEAVVGLAQIMYDMPKARAGAAAFIIASLTEPFGSASRQLFHELYDETLAQYVERIMPNGYEQLRE